MRGTLLAMLLVPLGTAAASAATVQQRPGGRVDEEPVNLVEVAGAPGEASSLTVTVRRSGPDRRGRPRWSAGRARRT